MSAIAVIYALFLYNIRQYVDKYTPKNTVVESMMTQAQNWKRRLLLL